LEVERIEATIVVSICLIVFAVGIAIGFLIRKMVSEAKIGSAKKEAESIIQDAMKTIESEKREMLLQAKEEIHKNRVELEREIKERRNEMQRLERRVLQKEEGLDKKIEGLEQKEEALNNRSREVNDMEDNLKETMKKEIAELERIAGMTGEEAKQALVHNIEHEVKLETALMIKNMEANAKEEASKKAQTIIATAIQKCAAEQVAEHTVSVVALPNDEMKGRIIGREGRNIKALETLTGIDLIIDDTPEAVILSGFDPVRREVARIALEKLILDGRIHPTRIEEMVEKAQAEVEDIIREAGESASFEVGVHGLHADLIRLLGKLKYRTSYGQNVLIHSIEVAHLAGVMASELGLDPDMAKRAGLLHDIGKAVDQEVEGSHVAIGVEILKKYKECDEVLNAVEAHHEDVEPKTVTAVLIQAADSISAARPGARKETLEAYIKRIEKIEEITTSFKGVDRSFAIQAGREVRIIVNPEDISDAEMTLLARDIAKRIEDDVNYPGQIKVNIVRETRVVDYAK
jgi:ribonuclease Y